MAGYSERCETKPSTVWCSSRRSGAGGRRLAGLRDLAPHPRLRGAPAGEGAGSGRGGTRTAAGRLRCVSLSGLAALLLRRRKALREIFKRLVEALRDQGQRVERQLYVIRTLWI